MEYKKIKNQYIVRVDKGEEVLTQLMKLCQEEHIELGSIIGIGATNRVTIGLFDPTEKAYHKTTLEGPMEITSLIGNISTKDQEVYLHLHINICNKEMQVFGGHLNECFVSATCELHITVLEGTVNRKFDEEIGLNLYQFHSTTNC